MAAPSFLDYYDIGLSELLSKRPDLTVEDGDISDMLVSLSAAMADRITGYFALQVLNTFVDGAAGDDLTALASDHWDVTRNEATKSTVTVTFSRAFDTAGSGTIATGTQLATTFDNDGNRITYVTTQDAIFGGTDLSVDATAEATTAGRYGNSAAGTILNILDPVFDNSIVVTNTESAVGGQERETDDELRQRIRDYNKTLRRATKEALEFGANQVVGVSKATAVEDEDTGLVTVYVSDADGGSDATMVTNVTAELENWRAAGVAVQVVGGATDAITLNMTLKLYGSTSLSEISNDVKDVIVRLVDNLDIGETLYLDAIRKNVLNSNDNILGITFNSPVDDIDTSTPGNLITITAADITLS